jgi:hypothetical protein
MPKGLPKCPNLGEDAVTRSTARHRHQGDVERKRQLVGPSVHENITRAMFDLFG